jgi:NAD(P)-dependent dehydrogenase (short-subunit alcohol dehydrogenase family)
VPPVDRENLLAVVSDVERTNLDPSDILLTDKVAVVTGGGGGIGQGIALALARFGCDVAVLDVVPERAAATEAAIGRSGRAGMGIACDVMDAAALVAAIDRVQERFGRLDILVNNVGGVRAGPFVTQPEASIRRHVELNLMSFVFASQAAAKHMIAGGRGGSILNVSSIEAVRAAPMYAVYSACKAGMVGFTRSLALELAEHRIRVNCLSPDHTITPGVRGNATGAVTPETWPDGGDWSRVIPLGRESAVEECAGTAVWLCSDLSSYITGVDIAVDGGTSAAGGWMRGRDGRGWTLSP